MKKKKNIFLIVGIVLVVVIGVAVLALPRVMAQQAGAQTNFQTEAAKMGSLTAYVGATGSVQANQTAQLAWQTSGQVEAVKVSKGQQVEVDTILATLEETSLSQSIIMAKSNLVSAQNELEKVMNNREARAEARLALIEAQKALDDAEKETQSKLYQRASQNTIDIARANVITSQEALESAQERFNQVSGRGDDDPVYAAALSQLARARQESTLAEYNLRYVEELPDPLDVEEVYVKLEQAKAKLLAAREEWERIKDGPDPDDIATAQAQVAAAQATLDQARMAAPFAGTVTAVDAKPGDMVNAGTPAFQIDDLSRLLVEVQVSEVDINRIQMGQPVNLTFDAITGQEYQGVVTDISSTGSSTSGSVNFAVTVEVMNPDQLVKPGMTAAVNIAVNQLDNVLLVPSRAVRTQNGERVVYVLRNGFPMPVEIELGSSSNTHVQVVEGDIAEGDLIVLNPPAVMPGMMGPARRVD